MRPVNVGFGMPLMMSLTFYMSYRIFRVPLFLASHAHHAAKHQDMEHICEKVMGALKKRKNLGAEVKEILDKTKLETAQGAKALDDALKVLILDGKVQRTEDAHGAEKYVALKPDEGIGLGHRHPCGVCRYRDRCGVGNAISPLTCPWLATWLNDGCMPNPCYLYSDLDNVCDNLGLTGHGISCVNGIAFDTSTS